MARLRIGGDRSLIPLSAFMAWRGKILPLNFICSSLYNRTKFELDFPHDSLVHTR